MTTLLIVIETKDGITRYTAWEPTQQLTINLPMHHTRKTINEEKYGEVASRVLNCSVSYDNRFSEETQWRRECEEAAYNAILANHPEAQNGRRRFGGIEVPYSQE